MRIKKITTLIISLNCACSWAAIVHTDINPDVSSQLIPGLSAWTVVSIDFDNDGNKEFDFRWDEMTDLNMGWYLHCTPNGVNCEFNLKGTSTNGFGARYIEPLGSGILIDSGLNWGSSNPEPLIGDDSDPNFQGLGDQYIGVKFDLQGNPHFGWILVSFDSGGTLTVKEYAYEDVPNTPISSGDSGNNGSNSLPEISNLNINCWPNPSSDFIRIEGQDVVGVEVIEIFNMNNQLVKQFIGNGQMQQKLDIKSLESGMYIIKINHGQYYYSQRITIH